jgi:hypothetical protein
MYVPVNKTYCCQIFDQYFGHESEAKVEDDKNESQYILTGKSLFPTTVPYIGKIPI